jgi:hypothetical protein
VGFVDDVGFDHQVLVDELGWVGVVGVDAADLGSGEKDLIGLFRFEEGAHGSLVREVELSVRAGDDVGLPLALQHAGDGGADHATVAGDVDFWLAHRLSYSWWSKVLKPAILTSASRLAEL